MPDDDHFKDAEHDSWRVAEEEDEDDAHEDDGQVVLLFAPGLLRGRRRVTGHGHLTTVSMLHVLIDLGEKSKKKKIVIVSC